MTEVAVEEVELDDADEFVPDVPEPVINVSVVRTVEIDASWNLGEGKKLSVKTTKTGYKISYTKRVKNSSYYGAKYRQSTESVTIPKEQVGALATLFAEAQKALEEND